MPLADDPRRRRVGRPPANRMSVEEWRRAQSEDKWLEVVMRLSERRGWLYYHTHDSRRSQPGFPDLVLVKPPRLIFAELKRHRGRVTPSQKVWLAALDSVPGVETGVWRPDQFDEIDKVLR